MGLFDMYQRITGENAYHQPMRIFPAVHYTMGGLWVDYNLQSTIPGLFVLGEANFSDHGANRLGASALMQGLADGYFVAPYTIGNYLAGESPKDRPDTDARPFKKVEKEVTDKIDKLFAIQGRRTPRSFHRELGKLVWEYCGMARDKAGLTKVLKMIPELRAEFWENLNITGGPNELNPSFEHASRVADFMEFAELLCLDALKRDESCGGHFRTEHQTSDGEARRDDKKFAFVSAWEYQGASKRPALNKEPLVYEEVKMTQRSYK